MSEFESLFQDVKDNQAGKEEVFSVSSWPKEIVPAGFERYYSGWNLHGFMVCFDRHKAEFDKSRIGTAPLNRTVSFFLKDEIDASDFNPFNSASRWALDRKTDPGMGESESYIPIVMSGLIKEDEVIWGTDDFPPHSKTSTVNLDKIYLVIKADRTAVTTINITNRLL